MVHDTELNWFSLEVVNFYVSSSLLVAPERRAFQEMQQTRTLKLSTQTGNKKIGDELIL